MHALYTVQFETMNLGTCVVLRLPDCTVSYFCWHNLISYVRRVISPIRPPLSLGPRVAPGVTGGHHEKVEWVRLPLLMQRLVLLCLLLGSKEAENTHSRSPFRKNIAVEGDTVILSYGKNETQLIKLRRGSTTQNRCGAIKHDNVIGKPYGSRITTSIGRVVILALDPIIWSFSLPHRTQIIYPPDASMIVGQLDLVPGSRVLEAGTGSGALTHALAQAVWPTGRVFTFDFHEERAKRAREEFEEHDLKNVVSVDHRDVIAEGFPEAGSLQNPDGCHAIMIDLPEPWVVVSSIAKCFAPSGGRVCIFSPCIEQVQRSCDNLRSAGFSNIVVLECVSRNYDFVHSILSIPNFGQKHATDLYNGTYVYRKPHAIEIVEGGRSEDKNPPQKNEPHLFPPLGHYISPNSSSKRKNGNRSDGYWAAVPRHKDTGHTGYLIFASYISIRESTVDSSTNAPSAVGSQDVATKCKEIQ